MHVCVQFLNLALGRYNNKVQLDLARGPEEFQARAHDKQDVHMSYKKSVQTLLAFLVSSKVKFATK